MGRDAGAAGSRAVLRTASKSYRGKERELGEEKIKENKFALLLPETQGD